MASLGSSPSLRRLESKVRLYVERLETITWPLRSVMTPREASTFSSRAMVRMDWAT